MPTKEEIKKEFMERELKNNEAKEDERKAKEAQKAQRVENFRQPMRGAKAGAEESKLENSDGSLLKPSKNMEDYEPIFAENTEFFSTYNPDMIEQALIEYIRVDLQREPVVSDTKYKIKFSITSADQSGAQVLTKMCVRILRVDDKTVCVEFQKLEGNQHRFLEHYKDFKNDILNFANDAVKENKVLEQMQ